VGAGQNVCTRLYIESYRGISGSKGVGYMAWKWICISLNSWMVILMVLVQYCTVSHIPGAKGGSLFSGLRDFYSLA
jgi:hypothetical protein